MLGPNKKSGLVALNLRPDRVEVARISRGDGARATVELCTSFRKQGSDEDALLRLRREMNLDRFRCATLLPAGDYQMQLIDAPNVPQEETKSAVRWRMKEFLDYPVEEATVDVVSIPGDPNAPTRGRSVYAISARNDVIASRMQLFSKAKLPLGVIDIPEMAQRNLAALFEIEHRGLAMLSFSEERGLLTFTADGELYLARSIEVGLSQLLMASAEDKESLFERVVLELQRSLDHFDRQFSYIPVAKLVVAPLPEEIGLEPHLMQNLYVQVEIANLDQVLDMRSAPELSNTANQLQHWNVIGAALRQEAGR
ncbi:MAG: agglutinin biogenesis protein MshI [Burkholderiales bacterium]